MKKQIFFLTALNLLTFICIKSSTPLTMHVDPIKAYCSEGLYDIQVTAIGGISPYTFYLDNVPGGPIFYGVSKGDHTFKVKDSDPNSQPVSKPYTNLGAFHVAINLKSHDCQTGDDVIVVIASGGIPPYFFYLNQDEVGTSSGSLEYPELKPGEYFIDVSDSGQQLAGCSISQKHTVAPLSMKIEANNECQPEEDRTYTITVSGGIKPYMYVVSDGKKYGPTNDTSHSFMLPHGTYTFTVTDSFQCQVQNTVSYKCLKAGITHDQEEISGVYQGRGNQWVNWVTLDDVDITDEQLKQLTFNFDGAILKGGTGKHDYKPPQKIEWLGCEEDHFVEVTDTTSGCYVRRSFTPHRCSVNLILELDRPDSSVCTRGLTAYAFGGTPPYHFYVDGIPYKGNNFNLLPGTYVISVEDSSEPYPNSVAKEITIPPFLRQTIQTCMPRNKLVLLGNYVHGAPIQSVAWSCANENCPDTLAAIGGYKGCSDNCECASVRVYLLEKEKLRSLWSDLPTNYVYCVTWCCIAGIPYLAVAGCPDKDGNSLWIYRYNWQYQVMELVGKSDAHKGIVYSVAWLCDECTDSPGIRNLAIGGEPVNNSEIKILQFNSSTQTISFLGATSFGTTVYALDVCKDINPCTQQHCLYLVAGGKTAYDCLTPVNIRIYAISCDGIMTMQTDDYFEGGTVRAAQWCCQSDKICPNYMYLAVGGDPEPEYGTNIKIYYYHPISGTFQPFAWQSQPEKVFTVNWLTGCQCKHLAAGSGCVDQDCVQNIFVYGLDKMLVPRLATTTSKHFDDNITSMAWCKIGDMYYVLAGSESNRWQAKDTIDPLCPINNQHAELVLYKGVFCKNQPLVC